MKILYLIPARGGSKGLPGKNIKLLCGKPLIAWTIEAALNCRHKGKIVVSTDDNTIAETARKSRAEIPFLRPQELAADTATSVGVVLHALDYFKSKNESFDFLVLLQPTSPLRDSADVDNAFDKLLSVAAAENIVGLSKVETTHPDFMVKIQNDFLIPFLRNGIQSKRRQELEAIFHFDGSLYISKVPAFLEKKSFFTDKTIGFINPKWKSFEIDDSIDFVVVEKLMEEKLKGNLK